jgi:hypothetical protein
VNDYDDIFLHCPIQSEFRPLKFKQMAFQEQLQRVTLAQSNVNPFDPTELMRTDLITMEDIQFCDYIRENPNNLIFIYGKQMAFVDRDRIKQLITDKNKVVYQCRELGSLRRENIISEPHLQMESIALIGVIVPLSHLYDVVNGTQQIFVIQLMSNDDTQLILASLGALEGEGGGKKCNEKMSIKIGGLSYVPNEVLFAMCPTGTGGRVTRRYKKRTSATKKASRRSRKSKRRTRK